MQEIRLDLQVRSSSKSCNTVRPFDQLARGKRRSSGRPCTLSRAGLRLPRIIGDKPEPMAAADSQSRAALRALKERAAHPQFHTQHAATEGLASSHSGLSNGGDVFLPHQQSPRIAAAEDALMGLDWTAGAADDDGSDASQATFEHRFSARGLECSAKT